MDDISFIMSGSYLFERFVRNFFFVTIFLDSDDPEGISSKKKNSIAKYQFSQASYSWIQYVRSLARPLAVAVASTPASQRGPLIVHWLSLPKVLVLSAEGGGGGLVPWSGYSWHTHARLPRLMFC